VVRFRPFSFATDIGSSLKRKMRQVFGFDLLSSGLSGSKVDARIASRAGFSKIRCELLRTPGRMICPFAFTVKQIVASPSMRSRRATYGYFGNSVIAGVRSRCVSDRYAPPCADSSSANPANGSSSPVTTNADRARGISAILVISLSGPALPVIDLDGRGDRVDSVHIDGPSDLDGACFRVQ